MKKNKKDTTPSYDYSNYDLDPTDDFEFQMNLDSEYDPNEQTYDAPEDGYYDDYSDEEDYTPDDESGYGPADEGGYNDRPPMSKRELRAYEKQRAKERKQAAMRGKNRKILAVMYTFIFIFVATIGYFVYYDAVGYKDVINRPGNVHVAKLRDKNVRGRILAADGSVLAETKVDSEGNETRYYPFANIFAHVVGTYTVNKSGLESSMDSSLLISNANPLEQAINQLKNEKNQGDEVVTTLNTTLQQVAYNALGDRQGAVVAIEPSTGKILAMVSKPDYDPNTLGDIYADLIADTNNKCLLNQATLGLFAPGSIFKIVTALEYIRENPGYESYGYQCNGSISLSSGAGSAQISCYHGTAHGSENLLSSFANSCNASFANIGNRLNTSQWNSLCSSLLFNQALPGTIGIRRSTFSLDDQATDWLIGATAIGQGETLMTPMHAAMLVSAIANGGVLMEPYIVDSVQNYTGDTVNKYMPKSYGNIITTQEAALLTEMMKQVVTSGTGYGLNGMGYSIAGKTGTAEVSNDTNNAWFVGFAPADNPDIAICVLVENTESSGSDVAVPIAQQLFYAYLTK